VFSRFRQLWLALLLTVSVTVAAALGAPRSETTPADHLHHPADQCGVVSGSVSGAPAPTAEPMKAGVSEWDFFSNYGSYRPRTHCMVNEAGTTDWTWVGVLLVLNCVVVAGYARIFLFWRRAFLAEAEQDRNVKLMDLAWIFLWCAVCGYISSIVIFFWPGYRALAVALVPLAFFTWRFAWNLNDFALALQAKRLQRQLTESLQSRNVELEQAVSKATLELDESLKQRNEELEDAVFKATSDLRDATVVAENANRAKSEFLANMSHEIRTPMSAVLGYTELLDDPEANEHERAQYVQTVRRNGTHLLSLINDILDLSKIEAGEMDFESIECSPVSIASDAVGALQPRAREQGITLSLGLDGPVPSTVLTDPTRLRQLFTNLVGNAVKFTPEGSVTVALSSETSGDDVAIRARIIDTGIGMTREQIAHIFEPFRQGDTSMTRAFGGTGLGLAISSKIVSAMGGRIEVESEPGHGSVFTLCVTARRAEEHDEVVEGVDSETPERVEDRPRRTLEPGVRVLQVEDGPENQRLLDFHLTRAGAVVDTRANGREGVDLALEMHERGSPYDLILMDMQMPVLDGYGATRELRRRGYGGIIVALTANAMNGDRDLCLRAGCDEYISKPFSPADLLSLCSRLLAEGAPSRQPQSASHNDRAA